MHCMKDLISNARAKLLCKHNYYNLILNAYYYHNKDYTIKLYPLIILLSLNPHFFLSFSLSQYPSFMPFEPARSCKPGSGQIHVFPDPTNGGKICIWCCFVLRHIFGAMAAEIKLINNNGLWQTVIALFHFAWKSVGSHHGGTNKQKEW